MSHETRPIDPARFAEALKELPASSLALKVLELRNSIAHLDYSNEELKPFAEGRVPTVDQQTAQPDQDCIDAIAENEGVIARMQERIELIRTEVEDRGLSWREFQGKPDEPTENTAPEGAQGQQQEASTENARETLDSNGVNGHTTAGQQQHEAWRDGTFQTGTIRGGLSDEELLRQLQERLPEMQDDNDDTEDGMHL